MKKRYKQKAKTNRKIALERVKILFEQAKKIFKEDPKLAHRYVYLARKISMRFKVRIPRELKRKFCKHCYKYLVPNINCRVRIHNGHVVYYCLECKKYMRFKYK